ncbi:ABC transporter ATP-binding protein [Streptomyces arenae]|uniref:ABC transporter ATP-binding protein n=1 Tax=Streptomyces arenae TaxID=29301 RepID=UPI00265AAE39|nr:ABC transporter ATP-binding protein [Streptomyces arenae]MCG7202618.1 ABC transporter ATP-binding protein/permease [Streptomyces arenae]
MFQRHAKISPATAFRRLWPLTRPERIHLWTAVACQTISVGCDTAAIQVFSHLTDTVLTSAEPTKFWKPAGLWLAVALLGAAVTFAAHQLTSRAEEGFRLRCRDEVFQHAQRLPPHYYENNPPGDLLARFTGDVDEAEHVVASGPVQLLNTVVSLVFFAGAALWLRWELALLTFAAAPVLWLGTRRLSRPVRALSRAERDRYGELVDALDENLANMPVVQAYNRQDTERDRVHRRGAARMRSSLARARLSNAYLPFADVVESLSVLAVVGAGAWEIAAGRLTVGGLLAFAAYLGYLHPQVQALGGLAVSISSATAACERLFEVLDTRPAVTRGTPRADDGPRPPLPPPPAYGGGPGVVTLDNVGFTYPGGNRRTVTGLDFTAHPGRLVLIDGPSGSGKSTLAKLLLRFYDPTEGRILLDGRDIASLPLRRLRELITLVPQDPMLLDGTIRENIAYGRPGTDERSVLRAAVAADVDGFARRLADGYDTSVGPAGRQLSGGQQRRVAIARALVRDTPVLVLDEPTTGLDGESARRVMEPLRRLMASRTTFLITHDAQLAAQADAVLPVGPLPEPLDMPPMGGRAKVV